MIEFKVFWSRIVYQELACLIGRAIYRYSNSSAVKEIFDQKTNFKQLPKGIPQTRIAEQTITYNILCTIIKSLTTTRLSSIAHKRLVCKSAKMLRSVTNTEKTRPVTSCNGKM